MTDILRIKQSAFNVRISHWAGLRTNRKKNNPSRAESRIHFCLIRRLTRIALCIKGLPRLFLRSAHKTLSLFLRQKQRTLSGLGFRRYLALPNAAMADIVRPWLANASLRNDEALEGRQNLEGLCYQNRERRLGNAMQ